MQYLLVSKVESIGLEPTDYAAEPFLYVVVEVEMRGLMEAEAKGPKDLSHRPETRRAREVKNIQ